MEKLKCRSLFKIPIPMNRSTGPGSIDRLINAVNTLTFQFFFYVFSHFLILPLPFLVEIPNFLCLMPREF